MWYTLMYCIGASFGKKEAGYGERLKRQRTWCRYFARKKWIVFSRVCRPVWQKKTQAPLHCQKIFYDMTD